MKAKVNTCPEFPYFGASYPDATCIDGQLYDLDRCGSDGQLYEMNEYVPCPFCNQEEFLQDAEDTGEDVEAVKKWITETKEKWSR